MAAYRVSNAAVSDLKNIGQYTQKTWGKEQRRLYLDALKDQFHVLSQSPLITAERRDFEPAVRIYHHEKHLIVYAMDDVGILILRVLHERMDVPAQLQS